MPLEKASEAYRVFNDKQDGCIKVGGWVGGSGLSLVLVVLAAG
jgi:hypothetical protein